MRVVEVLVATNRPSVVAFVNQLGERSDPKIAVRPIPLEREVGALDVGSASVGLVDMGTDADAAIALCQYLRVSRPTLPIVAIVCCPSPTMPWHIQGLRNLGVRNLLDAQATPEQIVDSLHTLAKGDAGLRVQFHHEYEALWQSDGLVSEEGQAVLKLVACGLGDADIAARLHVSPRTAQSRVEELRQLVRARNRTELAAWAGAHGLYVPADKDKRPASSRPASPRPAGSTNGKLLVKLPDLDFAESGNQLATIGKKSAELGSNLCQI